jgi:DNA-binding MarR family transcriptional regulator
VIASGERKTMSNEQSFEVRNFNDGEWCWINKLVIQEYASKVGPIGITIYSFLASMADSEQKCFPSQKYIAEKQGCSRATVSRTLKRLESNGLIRIEKRNRYHCAYQLSRVSQALGKLEQKECTDETQMSHTGNSDLHQSYTNDNYLTRNINNIDIEMTLNEQDKEFTPKTREELLALDLADVLNDRKALALYLSYARRFPESLLRKALGEAKEIPEGQIRKSRAALFNHLVRKYVKEFKEYKNNRDQSGN